MWGLRGGVAVWSAGIALFTVVFSEGYAIGGGVLILGASVGAAAAGAWLSPLFGRTGGWGWLWAFGAAVAVTVFGGAVAGAVFDPATRFGGAVMGALMGPAMAMAHPVPALVWLGGFGGLHLALRRWRGLRLARERVRVFAD